MDSIKRRRPFSPTEDTYIRQSLAAGSTMELIAAVLGRTQRVVWKRLDTLSYRGEPRAKPGFTPGEDRTLLLLRKQRMPYKLIARKMPGRSHHGLRARRYRLKQREKESDCG